ncbi:MAG: DapH/DapD/GlmU-related protein [Desulfitobacteriaceae bacterium]|nr:DapH/DapD/GlmU-related protein [Desulfitobacteriaceae bacterium]MDD4345919.1 DapH/DapD/GlmU-related protein [Desulfitobacteriaceae bacterium]MDD4401027.1 DapH/DapD/GlmU-related protein [Desulfitobacteriaceae bacterium]
MQRITNTVICESAQIPSSALLGPFCVVAENVILGERVILGAGCVLAAGVRLGDNCKLGNYVTLGQDVKLGSDVQIGDHTTVYSQAFIGKDCFIGSNSSVGRYPRPAVTSTVKIQSDLPALQLGEGSTVGCSAVLYAGSTYAEQVFVGDRAVVRECCLIGRNVIIGSGVTVENDTSIGAYTKVQTGSYVTAYMEIEERVFIAPMVTTTNDNFMGRTEKRFKLVKGPTICRGARVGGGSILLPGVKVAAETFVAAGALVTKDTVPRQVIKGFPAKEIREVPQEELLAPDACLKNKNFPE